ncbi:MAG: alpha/beta fold hydrolase [Chitinophagaceae bacterium]
MKRFYQFVLLLVCSFAANSQNDTAGYFNSFDGTKIYYEQKGIGETIVLVHGFIVNSESWKRTILYNELLAAGYRVILFDMRGNGKSDKPHLPEAYQKDAEAKDIIGLLDFLKVNKYIAIGYSRGSIITARLLLLDKRVQKAVIGGMGDGFTDPEWPRRKLFYRALMDEPVKELEGMIKYVKDSKLDQLALAYLQKEQPSAIPFELRKIKQRVLIISGDNDPDNGSPQSLGNMIPGSIVKVVPGNHGSTLGSSDFSKSVIEFIKN